MAEETKIKETTEEVTEELAPEKETTEETIEEETEETTEEIPPKKQTAQERINEITYKFRETEREAEYWKNIALAKEPPEPTKVSPKTGRPSQESYETAEEYEDALFDWYDVKRNLATLATTQKRELQENISNFNKNAANLRKEHEDFDKVMEYPVFTDPMRSVLFSSENGPMVAYHIATNKDIADKIKVLSPERQVYEIGKLETQLLLAQKTKKTTTAPNPISPVGITGSPEIDPSKMSTAEWMEWDKQQEIEKLKRKLGG